MHSMHTHAFKASTVHMLVDVKCMCDIQPEQDTCMCSLSNPSLQECCLTAQPTILYINSPHMSGYIA